MAVLQLGFTYVPSMQRAFDRMTREASVLRSKPVPEPNPLTRGTWTQKSVLWPPFGWRCGSWTAFGSFALEQVEDFKPESYNMKQKP